MRLHCTCRCTCDNKKRGALAHSRVGLWAGKRPDAQTPSTGRLIQANTFLHSSDSSMDDEGQRLASRTEVEQKRDGQAQGKMQGTAGEVDVGDGDGSQRGPAAAAATAVRLRTVNDCIHACGRTAITASHGTREDVGTRVR